MTACGDFVIDFDEIGGVGGDVAVGGDDDGDGMADEVDAVHARGCGGCGLRRPGRSDAADDAADVVDVFAGEDGDDAGERGGFRDIDGPDVGRAVRAADDDGVVHAGHLDVFDVSGGAGDEARIFAAADALADELFDLGNGGGHGLRSCLCRGADRVDDVLIAGAAAEIAVEPFADFRVGGMRDCVRGSVSKP